jgi:hypothetical protein
MAKRKAVRRARSAKRARKPATKRSSAKRQKLKRPVARTARAKAHAKKRVIPAKKAIPAKKKTAPRTSAPRKAPARPAPQAAKVPRLDRVRRTLEETLVTPPSSLDMERRGSAARSGRAEMAQSARNHRGMSPDITGGDVDVDVEDAYFTGDEAPGGDNPSPDLEVVDDIGKALGVRYEDDEELKGADKVEERDKHRWEMDPASSEDYKDRD